MTEKKIKFPWVFWISIRKRDWFKKFWKSRGANHLDIQFFKLYITIGLPWKQIVLKKAIEGNYNINGLKALKETNKTFCRWYHIHIGSYKD